MNTILVGNAVDEQIKNITPGVIELIPNEDFNINLLRLSQVIGMTGTVNYLIRDIDKFKKRDNIFLKRLLVVCNHNIYMTCNSLYYINKDVTGMCSIKKMGDIINVDKKVLDILYNKRLTEKTLKDLMNFDLLYIMKIFSRNPKNERIINYCSSKIGRCKPEYLYTLLVLEVV